MSQQQDHISSMESCFLCLSLGSMLASFLLLMTSL